MEQRITHFYQIPHFVFLWITLYINNYQLESTPGTNVPQKFKNEHDKSVSLKSKNYKQNLRKPLQ
jgi:hypothetical protein